ncbi:hypothetical protein PABG_00226 [Paracoccidioides brasiliensis Pb03]|nr:hypothetical protein PABG_00226 [Paracoccidioides brasiliensis Pb03]
MELYERRALRQRNVEGMGTITKPQDAKSRDISLSRTQASPDLPSSKTSTTACTTPILTTGTTPPCGSPPAWASNRPELCDALPWFRSLQGGCYFLDGYCWGFLVDADSGSQAYLDDEIIITRIGGGCEKNKNGELVQTKPHTGSGTIFDALMNSMKHEIPVGMIIGNKNSICPTKVPHRYNVMDLFRITNIWFEKVDKMPAARIRFEKLDLDSKSWWAPENSNDPIPIRQRISIAPIDGPTCKSCSSTSPRVYQEGWMCLRPFCNQFWRVNGSSPSKTLTYHPLFLRMRTQQKQPVRAPCSLVPDLLSTFLKEDTDLTSARVTWKGIVCPKCRRCISRKYWRGWICETEGCDFKYQFSMTRVSLRSVLPELEMGPVGHRLPRKGKENKTAPVVHYMKNYRKDMFQIPGVGLITHFAANNTVNYRERGPNDLFKMLQEEDLGLRRYPLQQSVGMIVAGTLTSHFAVNYGMPYKYVVSVDSRPFNTAPSVILAALGRLTWATQKTVNEDEFQRPNELLTLGYFEDMSIGYHDDGESSLGQTIATLSLGGKATMSIRMKAKYYHGCSRAGKLVVDDPVLPGCLMYEQRVELQRKLKDGEISLSHYEDSLQRLLKRKAKRKHDEEQMDGVNKKESSPFCVLQLNHGDMVVMHGPNLQKYYEHAVVPEGKLRFAMTARYVKPDQVDPSEHWKGDFVPNPEFDYAGDE